jgi:hypothetical protein
MVHAEHRIGSSAPHLMHLMADSRCINNNLHHNGFVPDDEMPMLKTTAMSMVTPTCSRP